MGEGRRTSPLRGWSYPARGPSYVRTRSARGPRSTLDLLYVYVPWPSQEECCIIANERQFPIGVIKDGKFFIK